MKRLKHVVLTVALAGATLVHALPTSAKEKHKSLFVETPATKTASPEALRCDTLKKGVSQHIETMKSLKAKIAKERQTPSNLEGMFQQWTGYGKPAPLDAEAKLERERRSAEEIAAMLTAYKCPPIDIDAELMKPTGAQKPAPAASAFPDPKGKVF